MVRKTYICNVCRKDFQAELADKDIFGFEWTTVSTSGPVANGGVHNKPCWQCENHICATCLRAMGYLAKQLLK